jgi:hypothetical protein
MRRHVQLFHLAQARRGPLGRRLNSKPPSEWPEHIKLAWAILHDELGLTEARAFQLILDSVSAAQHCAETVNRRSRNIVEANSHAKACLAFKRVANCCRRASAGLRRHLDEAILPLLAQDPIDSEVIEAIIDATAAEFELFGNDLPEKGGGQPDQRPQEPRTTHWRRQGACEPQCTPARACCI